MSGARCPVHDLALDPAGGCLRCRRASARPPARESAGGGVLGRLVGLGIALLAVGLISAVAIRTLESGRRPPPSRGIQPLSLDLPPPEPPAPVASAPPAKAPARARRPRAARTSDRASDDPPSAELPVWPPPSEPATAPPSRPIRIGSTQDVAPHAEPTRAGTDPRLASARRRVSITMYSTSWCGYCRRASAWMRSEGIRFVEHDVEHDARARARHRQLSPRGGVPTFEIDGTTVQGFSEGGLSGAIDRAAQRHL